MKTINNLPPSFLIAYYNHQPLEVRKVLRKFIGPTKITKK